MRVPEIVLVASSFWLSQHVVGSDLRHGDWVTLRSIIPVMSGSSLLNQPAQFPFAVENNDAWGRYTLRKQQYGNGMGMMLGR